MATLEAGLPTLDEREACTTQCEYMICEPGEHFNAFDINLGGDGGEEHNCVFGPEGCAAHICGGEEEQAVVASIDALIGQLEGSEFEAVDQRFEKFYLNYTRGAIQILGCDNQVLLSRPLSDSQISELGGPGRLEIASLGR